MRGLPLLLTAVAVAALAMGAGLVLTQGARGVDRALEQQRIAAERTAAIVRAIADEDAGAAPSAPAAAGPAEPPTPDPAGQATRPASTPPALPAQSDLAAVRAALGPPNVLMRIDASETWAMYGRVRLVLRDGWLTGWRDGGGHDHPWP